MMLHEVLSDPLVLGSEKWVRRKAWATGQDAWAVDFGHGEKLEWVPSPNGGEPITTLWLEDIVATDWEIVDPKDVCEGR